MFDCSYDAKSWIIYALNCLSADVFERCRDRLAFVCMDTSDGRRLTPEFMEGREIIVLSERIVPRGCLAEDHPKVRYFVFVVLHEIAHAVCQHRPPNQITEEKYSAQEAEAHGLAFSWFNDYLRARKHPDLREFTEQELKQAQTTSQGAAERFFKDDSVALQAV